MMMFMFDFMFISVITVKMIMFVAMFHVGAVHMPVPIMNDVYNLLNIKGRNWSISVVDEFN